MVLPLPPSKTNTSNKAWRDAVRWLRMRQMWSLSYLDASQPVNLSVNHGLTSTWSAPLSLVRTWFVPVPMCDHSQGVYFPPNTQEAEYSLSGFIQQTNKQTRGDSLPFKKKLFLQFHVCVLHPCSVFLDVYSVLFGFYLTTCVYVWH